jgi:Holliday junction resolvase RusA-like endonuclease
VSAAADRIVLRVPGAPVGKDRPRFSRTGRVYTTAQTARAQNDLRVVWQQAGAPRLPDDMAVALTVVLQVERPQSHWRKDGSLSAEGLRHPRPRSRKPDVDNVAKLVMDALEGLAYRNDVQVCSLRVLRRWGERHETIVTLRGAPRTVSDG